MEPPITPGPRRAKRAPLSTMSLLVGGTLCCLALFGAAMPTVASELARDGIVMRALGVTVGFAGFMLLYVAIKTAAGIRRVGAFVVAAPLLATALALLARPGVASWLYDTQRAVIVPWVLGVPGMLSLMLSRRRAG